MTSPQVQPLLRARPAPGRAAIQISWNWQDTAEEGGDSYATTFDALPALTGQWWLLRKQHGFPRTSPSNDAKTKVVASGDYGSPIVWPTDEVLVTDTDVEAGVWYYYALVMEDDSAAGGVVIEDDPFTKVGVSFAKAFAYGTWGHGEAMFADMSSADKAADTEGHLEAYLLIIGYLLDGAKTEAEMLLTLNDIWGIDAAALGHLAAKIGWEIDWGDTETKARQLLTQAKPILQARGRMSALETMTQHILGWDVTAHEGWRRLIRTDTPGAGTISDDPLLAGDRGGPDDQTFYTPTETEGEWHSPTGLLVIANNAGQGVAVTTSSLDKFRRLGPDFSVTFSDLALAVNHKVEEESYVGYTETVVDSEDNTLLPIVTDTGTTSTDASTSRTVYIA